CRQRPSYHSHAGSAVLCFPGKSKGRDVTNSAPTALLDRHKGRHGQGQERQRTLQGHTVRRAMCFSYPSLIQNDFACMEWCEFIQGGFSGRRTDNSYF
uniref:Uncharacterized protein n=1 Tax=Junco hyemalis TaxID=40217 RepID=A0A8C5NQ96_JUNHY